LPEIAVWSYVDNDHMDIYGDRKNLLAAFSQFINQVKSSGILILKKDIDLKIPENIHAFRYSLSEGGDYYAFNIRRNGLFYIFDIHTPSGNYQDIEPGVPGLFNVENSVAAFAVAQQAGADPGKIKSALKTYKGVLRRFDIQLLTEKVVFIDDYAHHPEELRSFISSVREVLPGKRLTGIFQPHLYSRTRDFADGFSKSLSLLDDVILLDIYPAREEPIAGVSSGLISDGLKNPGERKYCTKEQIFRVIEQMKPEVLLTMGAGDIDQLVAPLKNLLIKMSR